MIHIAAMLSGNYRLDEREMHFLEEIYPPENYVNPNLTRFRCLCCKRKHPKISQMGNGGPKKSIKETTQEEFEMILDRHLDLKNYFQLCQDFEIIRRVVFSQRQMVLSPLITFEAEKQAVDLLNKDKDYVQKIETGVRKLIGIAKKEHLDINKKEGVPPTCDGHDRIFREQSTIGMMFH
jgi:hypothetical protein